MLKPFGTTVSVVTFVSIFFEKYAWRWPIINWWLVQRPSLIGTWRTNLISSYRDPETGKNVQKTVYVVISQTLLSLSVRMYTDKAKSFSISQNITVSDTDGLFELAIVYQNVPDIDHRQGNGDSAMHYGALHLTDIKKKATELSGPYWTDRGTNGKVRLMERRKAIATSFTEAASLFA
ncbi:hypothetical protein EDB97_111148 [Agrobacterium tumefaciens]|nr:hypothetical protein EDB97_111148 [Agrobacterium tumefaciens]